MYPNRFLAFCDGNHIKTHQLELALTLQLPPALCAQADTPLFDRPHAALRAAVVRVVAKPNFDDDSGVLVLHDQIELTAAATKIFGDETQPLGQKKVQGDVFRLDSILQVFGFHGGGERFVLALLW